ncbi:hypothetical protein FSP39_021607 [Pinctada imbricata]|uniref:Neurotransmitter-gated ion-channel ligand-binding domain-containing protein n=1 Tax=Pinctada imbricata TaxID=66713 RepID=A0AA88Y7H1_PINIB|nr:hypothetical protein FSP39_021607 [Pinctada imbricata]
MGGKFYYIQIQNGGEVLWMPFEVFESRCSIDITYYPFDKQTCQIVFVVWSHSLEEISIERSKNGITYEDEFQENSVWKIIEVTHAVSKETRESRITFTFNLRRKPLFYLRLCHRGESPVTGIFMKLTILSLRLQCAMKRKNKIDIDEREDDLKEEKKEEEESSRKIAWSQVASAIDYVCFWGFLIVYAVMTLITFSIMLSHFSR